MKITGLTRTEPASLRKTERGKSASGAFKLSTPAAEAAIGPAPPTPLAAVDSLLALQEQSDSLEGRRQALRHGRDILDLLDDVRHGLLTGAIPESKLTNLVGAVRSARGTAVDPHLSEILAEVELRARVELAKLGRFT